MDIYTTTLLRQIVAQLKEPSTHLLDMYLPLVQTGDTEEIQFDVDTSKPRITPFVSPLRPGVVLDSPGYKTNVFKPAYAKDKRRHLPNRPLKRLAGEQIGGEMSPMQRREMALAVDVMDQLEMLVRRRAVMASEVLRTGKKTVTGEGYPTVVVDFGRDAALTIALLTTARWGETDVEPLDNLESWINLTVAKSGAAATSITMDPLAWQLFRESDKVDKRLDTRRGSTATMETAPLARDQRRGRARYVGFVGEIDIRIYQEAYVDAAGAEQQVLPDYTVMGAAPADFLGTQAYGVIQDEKAGYTAQQYFIKSWLEEDPAVRWLLLQASLLPDARAVVTTSWWPSPAGQGRFARRVMRGAWPRPPHTWSTTCSRGCRYWHRARPCAQRSTPRPETRQRHRRSQPLPSR